MMNGYGCNDTELRCKKGNCHGHRHNYVSTYIYVCMGKMHVAHLKDSSVFPSQTNMASSNIPSDTSTTRTLRDSDTFSEIETESTTVGHGSRASFGDKLEKLEADGYIAKPEMSVGREEIGFAKSRRISYNSNETAPPPYTESPSYSLSFARAGRGDRYHEHTYEHEHEYEHEPRTLSMYLFFLGFRTFCTSALPDKTLII